LQNLSKVPTENSALLSTGGGPSEYSLKQNTYYKFPPHLKSTKELSITKGWAQAVTTAHTRLLKGELAVDKPILVLYTDADLVLSSKSVNQAADNLSPKRIDGLDAPLETKGLVERLISSSEWDPSSHDVLAAPSMRRVDQAMEFVLQWLSAQEFVPTRRPKP
jgi:hypothetical protein